ncbi:hypothetical protein LWI28_021923 [Acer negundo]|uniref:RRM domain-containing protein n=1 Tax=Acer negundo TaxID=4023 RepID=A0AAD5IRA9_ACENE|nr:hypothetical protein LWI28_021923 [Acer negundo]
MMREKARERSSNLVHGYGRDKVAHERFKDFRENLVSIFVDNVNDQVDTMCIWGIFKPFGKVRDVYFAEVNSKRKIGYAFVRFGSLEKAKKVAGLTNGMHVYGSLIRVKVVEHGWNRRRRLRQSDGKSD